MQQLIVKYASLMHDNILSFQSSVNFCMNVKMCKQSELSMHDLGFQFRVYSVHSRVSYQGLLVTQ